MGKVVITLGNGTLGGAIQTNDGTSAMCVTGVGAGTLALNTVITVYSLADAISKGVTLAAEPFAYKHVNEFYLNAPNGTPLWLMLVVNTVTLTNMCDKTVTNSLKKVIDAANGAVSIAGVARLPQGGYSGGSNAIDSDSVSAETKAHQLAQDYQAKYTPVRVFLDMRVLDVTNVTVHTPNTQAFNTVVPVLGGSTNDGNSGMGLALGRAAKNHVQRNIGAVEDGALGISAAYIGNATVESLFNAGSLDAWVTAGYCTIYKYPQKAGYFWSDDPTCVASTDDYSSLARGRVIDKAIKITYATYVNKVNTDILVNKDGTLDAGTAKALEGIIENAVNTSMAGEISACKASIDLTQNVISNNKITIVLRIQPKAYLKEIDVTLGFATSL